MIVSSGIWRNWLVGTSVALVGLMGCTTILGFDKSVESADEAFQDDRTKNPDGQPGVPDGGSDDLDSGTKKDGGELPTEPYLDPTFGHRGRVEISAMLTGASLDKYHCYLDVGSDAKIWAACSVSNAAFRLVRLLPDGQIDPALGDAADGGGLAVNNVSLGGMAAQGTKVVLALSDSSGSLIVKRLEADGRPDTTLGPNGAVGIPVGSRSSIASLTRRDGDFLLTGAVPPTPGAIGRPAVATFLGASNTFSSTVLKPPKEDFTCLWGCKSFVLSDGRILLFGNAEVRAPDPFWVDAGHPEITVRYDHYGLVRFAGGAVDTSFGAGGAVQYPAEAASTAIPNAAQADGHDNIVVSGLGGPEGNDRLVRFTKDGALDPTFGTGGTRAFEVPDTVTPSSGGAQIFAMTPLRNDRFYVGGIYKTKTSDLRLFVARLAKDGSVDPTFADRGYALPMIHPETLKEWVNGLELLPDGTLLAAGLAKDGGEMFVLRFKP
jgi:uncharacterized delta-60 repeat protein